MNNFQNSWHLIDRFRTNSSQFIYIFYLSKSDYCPTKEYQMFDQQCLTKSLTVRVAESRLLLPPTSKRIGPRGIAARITGGGREGSRVTSEEDVLRGHGPRVVYVRLQVHYHDCCTSLGRGSAKMMTFKRQTLFGNSWFCEKYTSKVTLYMYCVSRPPFNTF